MRTLKDELSAIQQFQQSANELRPKYHCPNCGTTSAQAGSPTHEVRSYTMTSAPTAEHQQTLSKDRTHILCMLYWALGVFTGIDIAMMIVILLA